MPKICVSWLVFMALFLGVAHAETIVVAASGNAGLEPGTRLDESVAISLPAGARITVLSRSGAMQVLDGPYSGFPAGQAESDPGRTAEPRWSAVLALVGDPDARSNVMGASRKTDGDFIVPPGIWHVSVDSSGPRCTEPENVVLWRRDAARAEAVSVRSAAGRLTDIDWPAGDQTLTLPSPFALDGRMMVSVGGDLRDLELAVAPVDVAGGAPGAILGWLVDRKCKRQALTLIERVHAGIGAGN
ncbi:hypothetical protein GCM10011316_02910 [Roseibium aquae]|uniref:Uncharacterized protein n=1 Tax=Roseibium aquae TaxID=1323746 RepID=A0A916T770_9HYPH|nr:hypothetical protein [Roseibium aquae]GGB34229.1 hypothetical protein GCM10011316_02910 [Roseibium aquae]